MYDTSALAVGYAWDNKSRDWTKRVEYLARTAEEARNWVQFNRDWMLNLQVFTQHDQHVFDRLLAMD